MVDGTTQTESSEPGLDAEARATGFVLACVRRAATDLVLDVEDLGGAVLAPPRTWPCRIQDIERVAADVLRVRLRLPPTAQLSWLPGQYVDVTGPGSVRRSYSIANAPRDDGLVELHIKRVEGGVLSAFWFEAAAPGVLLRLRGPLGTFFLRERPGPEPWHVALLATGTGLAPVKAILEDIAARPAARRPDRVSLHWGARREADLYWRPDESLPIDHYVPVLSRADSAWSGARGYVQQALLDGGPDLAVTIVYACGSAAMIHDARDALMRAGLPGHRFLSDAFVASTTA